MDAPGKVPEAINCHSCGAAIDLTGQQGFTHVECAQCGALSVVPLQLGNFLLLNALGIGGMGTVYKAVDLSLNPYLALKILRKKLAGSPDFIQNFIREARAAASINHPNVAQVYAFGELDGQYYLSMELLERGSLDDRMAKLGKIPEADVLEIGARIAEGLRAANQRGLLHRDIKPGNILFNEEGVPKIVDFGLARPKESTKQGSNEPIWGTPYYIAPEKLRGQTEDIRSDMYSLGAAMFHALAGRPPFDAATASEVVTKHATQPAMSLKTFVPDLQGQTAQVIGRMLAKNPAERYETYDALIHDLKQAQQALKDAHARPTIVVESGERISMGAVFAAIGGLLFCLAVVILIWFNRAKLLGGQVGPTPPAPPVIISNTKTVTVVAPPPVVLIDTVDFNELGATWVKPWNAALLQLAQGRYDQAYLAFDGVKSLVLNRPRHRQWIAFFQGVCLMSQDRASEAVNSFVKAVDPIAKTVIPDKITTANFVDVLSQTMLDSLPEEKLADRIPSLPDWAAGLARLTLALKRLEKADYKVAAESFRAYQHAPPNPQQSWAFSLQPLADRLARECDKALVNLAAIDQQTTAGNIEEALRLVREFLAKAKVENLRADLKQREAALQKTLDDRAAQADEQRRAAEEARLAKEREIRGAVVEETKRIQAALTDNDKLWNVYDFNAARAKLEAVAAPTTEAGKQLLESRLAPVRLLIEYKNQLAADFRRQPYDAGNIQTRNNVRVSGRIIRATDTQLIFGTPYGELVANWSDLPATSLQKMGETYIGMFAPMERPEARAHRYLLLGTFCRQYDMERLSDAYLKQAVQLVPALQKQIDVLFPPPPPPAPEEKAKPAANE